MDVSDYAIPGHSSNKKDHLLEGKSSPSQNEESVEGRKIPLGGVLTIIGGFIICLSFGSDFSYPNINTYLTSYMRQNGYNDGLA